VIIWAGPAKEMNESGVPEVHQFVHGLAEGPLTNEKPAAPPAEMATS
jgi:ABC-type transporter Mla maintaining outer membrane lipid asymmetry ATPase subunit MlaF